MTKNVDRLLADVKEARAEFEARLDEMDAAKERYYDTVRRLYKAGTPLRDIAEAVGVSHQRVHQIVGEGSTPARVRRAVAKHARAGGIGVLVFLLGAWWGVTTPPPESRADAIAKVEVARAYISAHLSEEARDFISPKLDALIERADP